MKNIVVLINQVFEIHGKLIETDNFQTIERNINRINSIFEEEGYIIQNPLNEVYTESRTDCEANIVGNVSTKMVIKKVLKPVIYQNTEGQMQLVQKAVVIVEKN